MHNQACEPCAKRKVRCDREEPCSNCKRRKQDRCVYPELSPADRIKELETLVRTLGGDPTKDVAYNSRPQTTAFSPSASSVRPFYESPGLAGSNDTRPQDPVILEEDGQQSYLESCVHQLSHSSFRTDIKDVPGLFLASEKVVIIPKISRTHSFYKFILTPFKTLSAADNLII